MCAAPRIPGLTHMLPTTRMGTHLASSPSCEGDLAPRRGAVQLLLIAPAGRGLVCFWIPTWSTQRQHLGATSLPHDLNRLRIKAPLPLLRPPERHGQEGVDHRPLQGDRSLQESRCRIWRPEDGREHGPGTGGQSLRFKPSNLSPSSSADAGEVGTLDHLGVIVTFSASNAGSPLCDLLRERVLDLGVRLLLAPLEVLLLEPGDDESPNEVVDRVSGPVEMPGVARVVAGAGSHRLPALTAPVKPCPQVFANSGAAAVRHAGRVVEKVLHRPPLIGLDNRFPLPEDEFPILVLDEVVSQGLAARLPASCRRVSFEVYTEYPA